jgi:hypothetical protein
LTTQIENLKKKGSGGQWIPTTKKSKKQGSQNASKWNYIYAVSTSKALNKNNKIYIWYTGSGHHNLGMCVLHKPGTCIQANKKVLITIMGTGI